MMIACGDRGGFVRVLSRESGVSPGIPGVFAPLFVLLAGQRRRRSLSFVVVDRNHRVMYRRVHRVYLQGVDTIEGGRASRHGRGGGG